MNATTTFQVVAKELADAFEQDVRSDQTAFVKIKDDAAAWVKEGQVWFAVHQALDDRGPDDWTYAAMQRVADDLAERSLDDADAARESVSEIADGLVDIYNIDRARWLAMHINNAFLVDEANKEFGHAETLYESIGRGQYLAYERIANALIEAIETEVGNREE